MSDSQKPSRCPLCGHHPAFTYEVKGVYKNTFSIGCRAFCPDCGVMNVARYGEYCILESGNIVPVVNAVNEAVSSWNHEANKWHERLNWRDKNDND